MRSAVGQCPKILAITMCAIGLQWVPVALSVDDVGGDFFDRFSEHVQASDAIEAKAKSMILETLADRDADSDEELLLIESLVLMSPAFRDAMDAYDEDRFEDCIAALDRIGADDDSYVRHNGETYRVRALVHLDRLVEARDLIAQFKSDHDSYRQFTLDVAEMDYLLGYCQIQTLQYDAGRETLERFLADYPDASQRFVVTARQMLAELERLVPESMGEVSDLMGFSQRRLAAVDTGEAVLAAQSRIIEILDKLQKKAQDQEQQQQQSQSQSQSQRDKQRQQRQQQQQNSPNNPMPDSEVDDQRARLRGERSGREVTPGEAWGTMPDAQREKVLQVLRDSFPGRYRSLVEQYYKTLAEEP